MKYEKQKEVWKFMNSIGFELEVDTDCLLDVEPFTDHNLGELADLMIQFSDHKIEALETKLTQHKDFLRECIREGYYQPQFEDLARKLLTKETPTTNQGEAPYKGLNNLLGDSVTVDEETGNVGIGTPNTEIEGKPVLGDFDTCFDCKRKIVYNGKYWQHSGKTPRHIAVPTKYSTETPQPTREETK